MSYSPYPFDGNEPTGEIAARTGLLRDQRDAAAGDAHDGADRALRHPGADLLFVLVDATTLPGPGDLMVLDHVKAAVKKQARPVILVLNKIDLVNKMKLLPVIETYAKMFAWTEVVPVSAQTGDNLERLLTVSGIGEPTDIAKAAQQSEGLGVFVRSLVGMDRAAAKHAMGGFADVFRRR